MILCVIVDEVRMGDWEIDRLVGNKMWLGKYEIIGYVKFFFSYF